MLKDISTGAPPSSYSVEWRENVRSTMDVKVSYL